MHIYIGVTIGLLIIILIYSILFYAVGLCASATLHTHGLNGVISSSFTFPHRIQQVAF